MDDILDHPSVSSSSWSAAAQAAVPNPPPAPVGASSHQSGPVTSGGSKVSAGGLTDVSGGRYILPMVLVSILFCSEKEKCL